MKILNENKIEIKKNTYLRIEGEEIKDKINIMYITDETRIEELDIGEEIPNVLVYKNKNNRSFENIFNSVRILITDIRSIAKGSYKTIPENIERVIINNIDMGDIKENRVDLIEFIAENEVNEYIENEFINKGKYNNISKNGNNILLLSIKRRIKEKYEKIIENINNEIILRRNDKGKNALEYAIENFDIKTALKLLEKIENNNELIEKNYKILEEIVIMNKSYEITGKILKINKNIKKNLYNDFIFQKVYNNSIKDIKYTKKVIFYK
jgi:hypothetical protein